MPLFVTFLAAIIGAFAAFFVWLELLMRDAAIYVVALFMPMALAASIWPRWSGALRRTGELLVVVIGSKFVIVSIISLAAGLVAETDGAVEHILAAAALMLLACFAPFVLLKLVPFAEGAMAAAYGRRSAAGGAVSGVQLASDAQILRNMARSNWGESGATLWNAGRDKAVAAPARAGRAAAAAARRRVPGGGGSEAGGAAEARRRPGGAARGRWRSGGGGCPPLRRGHQSRRRSACRERRSPSRRAARRAAGAAAGRSEPAETQAGARRVRRRAAGRRAPARSRRDRRPSRPARSPREGAKS